MGCTELACIWQKQNNHYRFFGQAACKLHMQYKYAVRICNVLRNITMAFTAYHNITGSTGVNIELLAPGDNVNSIKSITITNTHATADATVSLFIQDDPSTGTTSTYKILSTIAIPSDTTFLVDESSMLSFNNGTDGYGLYLTVGSSDTLDVLINI